MKEGIQMYNKEDTKSILKIMEGSLDSEDNTKQMFTHHCTDPVSALKRLYEKGSLNEVELELQNMHDIIKENIRRFNGYFLRYHLGINNNKLSCFIRTSVPSQLNEVMITVDVTWLLKVTYESVIIKLFDLILNSYEEIKKDNSVLDLKIKNSRTGYALVVFSIKQDYNIIRSFYIELPDRRVFDDIKSSIPYVSLLDVMSVVYTDIINSLPYTEMDDLFVPAISIVNEDSLLCILYNDIKVYITKEKVIIKDTQKEKYTELEYKKNCHLDFRINIKSNMDSIVMMLQNIATLNHDMEYYKNLTKINLVID